MKAAREFSQTATGSKGGRQRLLSKPSSLSSTPSSPRSSAASLAAASEGYPPLSATPRSKPVTRSQTGSLPNSPSSAKPRTEPTMPPMPAFPGTSPLHGWPIRAPTTTAVSTAAQQLPATQAWNTFAAKPSIRSEDRAVEDLTKSSKKAEMSDNNPTTASLSNKGASSKPRTAWQITDVTNTLKGRAGDTQLPPHLRAKAAAGAETKPAGTTGTSLNPIVIDGPQVMKAQPVVNGTKSATMSANEARSKAEAAIKKLETKLFGAKESDSKPSPANGMIATVNGTPAKTNNQTTTPSTIANPTKLDTSDDGIVRTLEAVMMELRAVSQRVGSLEQDNFAMQKQLETMLQAEERRKFLGTENAKAPFVVEVQCRKYALHHFRHGLLTLRQASGPLENVQVTAELKISELIRRVRTKANLPPAATKDPRVTINGEQVGHAMTLGEVGVGKDKPAAVVVFIYDGAKEGFSA